MSQFKQDAKAGGYGLLWLVIGVVVLGALVVGGTFFFGSISKSTADFLGGVSQTEKVKADGNYRIANYERFYDMDAAITSLAQQVCVMKANTTLPADQRETNVLALTNQRITLVNQYNADARKNDTRANYLASDLPYEQESEFTCP